MPAFFDIGRSDEEETKSRQPVDGFGVPLIEASDDDTGWRVYVPLVSLWQRIRRALQR